MDDVVRLGIRPLDVERPARVVRRVNHRQHHVNGFREWLPRLSDLERAVDGSHEAEHIGSRANTGFRVPRPRRAKKLGEHLRLRASGLSRENLAWKTAIRLREADVIELNLPESHPDRFVADAKVVLPDLVRVRVHPGETLLVAPRGSIR